MMRIIFLMFLGLVGFGHRYLWGAKPIFKGTLLYKALCASAFLAILSECLAVIFLFGLSCLLFKDSVLVGLGILLLAIILLIVVIWDSQTVYGRLSRAVRLPQD